MPFLIFSLLALFKLQAGSSSEAFILLEWKTMFRTCHLVYALKRWIKMSSEYLKGASALHFQHSCQLKPFMTPSGLETWNRFRCILVSQGWKSHSFKRQCMNIEWGGQVVKDT